MAASDKQILDSAEAEMAAKESAQTSGAGPSTTGVSIPPLEMTSGDVAQETPTVAAPSGVAVEEGKQDTTEGLHAGDVTDKPVWPDLPADSPLKKLNDLLPDMLQEVGYDEVYGIRLQAATQFLRNLVLQKFLRANANDVEKAAVQLRNTLTWRQEFQPVSLPEQTFSKEKFGGLAYVSTLTDVPDSPNKTDVVCWNIYGAVKDNKATFGDLDAFIKWRVAVMEAAMAKLRLNEASEPIPNYGDGVDPYMMIQVHDYKNISFLRQDPDQKAAARKAIDTFSAYYPETLSRKMFVNVPTIMGWMFSAMKLILAKETVRKFTVISDAKYLVGELGKSVAPEYGGTGQDLEKAEELRLD